MNNYIYKIAKNNIKKDKKLYKYIFISIFITFFVLVLSNVLTESFQYVTYLKNIDIYGQWDMIFVNEKKIEKTALVEEILQNKASVSIVGDKNITDVGHLYIGGEVIYQNMNLGYIGYYDDMGLELANLQILEGRYANNENEVVIEESVQQEYDLSINQNIKLTYVYDNYEEVKEYKIVGIVQNYSTKWTSRGLTFITSHLQENETDVMVKADNIFNLWNGYKNGFKNTNIHPNYRLTIGTTQSDSLKVYTNESNTIQNMIEIIIIAFIAIICTMMSSLNKRESQFVMLRSIGMTYKQLKRLIIYECSILAIVAGTSAIILGFITSAVVMYIYTSITHLTFGLRIEFVSLIIEVIVCILLLAIGIILPILTVYDLPLTRRNGEFIYHSKKRHIKKPIFLRFVKNDILLHKGYHILMIILVAFMVARGTTLVTHIKEYFHSEEIITNQKYEGDYIWNNEENELDYSMLQDNSNIQVNTICIGRYFTDMTNDQLISVICIENDNEVKEDIQYQGIKNDEVMILLYEGNTMVFDDYIGIENTKDYSDEISFKLMKIGKITYLSRNIVRDYLKSGSSYTTLGQEEKQEAFAIVVNKNTYEKIKGDSLCNHIIVNVKNELTKIQVHNYFINQLVYYHLQGSQDVYMNIENIKNIEIYNLNENLIAQLIYTIILVVAFAFIISLTRLLIVYKLRKEIGTYHVLGMTRKKIYLMYVIEGVLTYMICFVVLLIYWYVFENQAHFKTFMDCFDLYLISSLIMFVIYMFGSLLPIYKILNHRILDLMNEKIQ